MTRWHIPNLWLVVSLIALILAIFITCKKTKKIKADEYDALDYKDSKVAFGESYEAFNSLRNRRGRHYLTTSNNRNSKRKPQQRLRTPHRRSVTIDGSVGTTTTKKRIIRTTQKHDDKTETTNRVTRRYCVNVASTLRARHKSCFLRPDTGPCRADIIQWYFDARLSKCFRFFWGGCQGNGNKFENKKDCLGYCFLNTSLTKEKLPYFCKLPFDFGSCFGHYYRWYWDKYTKVCKRRLYSGCGGNQNNFQSYDECFSTCVTIPNDTIPFYNIQKGTTCISL